MEENKYRKSNLVEMNIVLKKHIFFPSLKIEGYIELTPKIKIKANKEQKIIFKLTQFRKCEYQSEKNGKIENHSESSEDLIINKVKDFYLEKNDLSHKTKINFNLLLPGDEQKNFYPTFEYRKKDVNIFIRHLLTLEIPDIEAKNSIGVIICKLPEKKNDLKKKDFNIFKDKTIKTLGLINKGKFTYEIRIKKLSYSLDEEIPLKLNIISKELKEIKIDSVDIILQKKIAIKGSNCGMPCYLREENYVMYEKKYSGLSVKKDFLDFDEILKAHIYDIPDFTDREIERYSKFDLDFIERDDQRMHINPSINIDQFICQYKVKINFRFNSFWKGDLKENFIIDMYTMKPSSNDEQYIKYLFLGDENSYFDSQIFTKKEEDYIDNDTDFIILENKDFHQLLNGEENNNNSKK